MKPRTHLTLKQKKALLALQRDRCAMCGMPLIRGLFQFDHTQALEHDGDNLLDNWRALCTKPCHATKTKRDNQAARKRDRLFVGGKARKSRPMDGTKASGLRKRMDGRVERW